jgi:hypothetical protein
MPENGGVIKCFRTSAERDQHLKDEHAKWWYEYDCKHGSKCRGIAGKCGFKHPTTEKRFITNDEPIPDFVCRYDRPWDNVRCKRRVCGFVHFWGRVRAMIKMSANDKAAGSFDGATPLSTVDQNQTPSDELNRGFCYNTPCDDTLCDDCEDCGDCENNPCENTLCEDTMCENTLCEDTMCENNPCENTLCEDTMCEDTMCENNLCEDTPCEDTMCENTCSSCECGGSDSEQPVESTQVFTTPKKESQNVIEAPNAPVKKSQPFPVIHDELSGHPHEVLAFPIFDGDNGDNVDTAISPISKNQDDDLEYLDESFDAGDNASHESDYCDNYDDDEYECFASRFDPRPSGSGGKSSAQKISPYSQKHVRVVEYQANARARNQTMTGARSSKSNKDC